MNESSLITQYIGACFAGKLPAAECGGVWQFVGIGALIVAAVVALVVMRLRARKAPSGDGR